MKAALANGRPVYIEVEYNPKIVKGTDPSAGRSTNITVQFLDQEGDITDEAHGHAVCHYKDNFSRLNGRRYALRDLFNTNPSHFSYEDKRVLYQLLCRPFFLPKNHNLIKKLTELRGLVEDANEGNRQYIQDELTKLIRKFS